MANAYKRLLWQRHLQFWSRKRRRRRKRRCLWLRQLLRRISSHDCEQNRGTELVTVLNEMRLLSY
jgi:hypothetical protein